MDFSAIHADCEPFQRAKQSGTDNEGYGRLLYGIDGKVFVGCNLAPLKFCPWCGRKL